MHACEFYLQALKPLRHIFSADGGVVYLRVSRLHDDMLKASQQIVHKLLRQSKLTVGWLEES